MIWIINNKGSVIITLLAVVLGVLFGLFTYSLVDRAEAVLGGTGNLTDTNNPHNLSSTSAGIRASTETRICIFCHTPHNAITDSSLLNAPLWNHTLSTASYIINTSPAGPATRGGYFVNQLTTPIQPDGASKLCLSCHDGTVAIGDIASRVANITMASNACLTDDKLNAVCNSYIGTDLRVKHVVSIPMNTQLIANSSNDCNNIPQITTSLRYPWDTGGDDRVKLRPTTAKYPTGIQVRRAVLDVPRPALLRLQLNPPGLEIPCGTDKLPLRNMP
jgi:hypothetical protein